MDTTFIFSPADINYPFIAQLLRKGNIAVVPVETGYEVLIKSIATIKYIQKCNPECSIFIVFNKLDSSDSQRELKYSGYSEELIRENVNMGNIQFQYIRYSFALHRKLEEGFFFLDNYIYQKNEYKQISSFGMLQNIRWYTIDKMLNSKLASKAEKELGRSDFYQKYQPLFTRYMEGQDITTMYDLKFCDNNRKLIKDMLTLITHIRDEYTLRWKVK